MYKEQNTRPKATCALGTLTLPVPSSSSFFLGLFLHTDNSRASGSSVAFTLLSHTHTTQVGPFYFYFHPPLFFCPMPRSFLITNRRYDLSPPPSFEDSPVLSPSGLSLLFPHQFTTHLANQLHAIQHEMQEEAEDLSMKKHPKQQSSTPPPKESKESLSPFTKCPNGDIDSHVCPDCGKCYSTSSNLARHRQTHRSVTDQKARKCPHCEKVYVSSPAYSMHVRTHSQGCQVIH